MKYTIEKYKKTDKAQLEKLLDSHAEDDSLFNILDSAEVALSAFAGNKLVGFVTAWTNKFHPHCIYFRILSEPHFNIEKNCWKSWRKSVINSHCKLPYGKLQPI